MRSLLSERSGDTRADGDSHARSDVNRRDLFSGADPADLFRSSQPAPSRRQGVDLRMYAARRSSSLTGAENIACYATYAVPAGAVLFQPGRARIIASESQSGLCGELYSFTVRLRGKRVPTPLEIDRAAASLPYCRMRPHDSARATLVPEPAEIYHRAHIASGEYDGPGFP